MHIWSLRQKYLPCNQLRIRLAYYVILLRITFYTFLLRITLFTFIERGGAKIDEFMVNSVSCDLSAISVSTGTDRQKTTQTGTGPMWKSHVSKR